MVKTGGEKPTAIFEVPSNAKTEAPLPYMSTAIKMAYGMISDTWIPSRFNVSVDLPGNRKAVYNTFTSAIVILKQEIWNKYFNLDSEYYVSGELISEDMLSLYLKGFIVPKGIDEIEPVRLQFLSSRHRNDILSVNIIPTLACNLQCPYCFEGKAKIINNQNVMSRETEDAVIQYIDRLARGKNIVQVVWFGGEPLLSITAIERISSRLIPNLERRGIEYRALTSTNATLLIEDVVEQLYKCKVFLVQVTVDIPKSMKQDKFGRDTLEKVLDNLTIAVEKLRIYLRINLSRDDEKEFNQLYNELIKRNLHKRLISIGIANVFRPECGWSGCVMSPVTQQWYVEVMKRESAKAQTLGLPFNTFLPLTERNCNVCAATCESSAVVDPDGLLYKCVEDVGLVERAYGSVFFERPVNYNNLLPWLTYDWFGHKMCRECPVLPQCGGGCPHKRIFQSEMLKDEDFCYWQIRGDLENRIRKFEREIRGVS